MPNDSYSVHEASRKLGIPIQKLRRWDRQGVLVAQRTAGGHRRYSREIIDHLAQSCGPGLKENEELASARRSLAAKRRIIQLLLESENRFRDLVETSHDLIWTTDSEGRFTYLNNAAQEIFGLPPDLLIGRCFFDFEAKPSHVSNRRFLLTLRKMNEVKNFVTHLIGEDGREHWVGINARVSYNDHRVPTGIRGTARDITEQHLAAQRIEHLAKHDPLTSLPNRVSLQQTIENALAQAGIGAVLFVDLDHFKYVNDNFGHKAGDMLIVGIAGVLREAFRETAVQVYRLGGDEFAVHMAGGLRKDAVDAAEKILEAVRHYKLQAPGNRRISNLTASIGIALYPFHGGDIVSVLSSADIAMYQAKDRGRNRYMLFDQEATNLRSTHRRVHWSKKLREALDEDRLVLYSQPVFRLSDRAAVHSEVLVRIRDDDGNIILPGQFIEIAESLGIVQEVDMAVVQKLLVHVKSEKRDHKVRYFVNLSRVSISDHRWVRRFHQMMAESGVDLSQLVFEITETAAMSEIDVTLSFIRELKALGCRFALDDFGAGFSSFYYLKRFDVDYLKIDGSFIRDLATDEGSQVFVKALCEVARGLSKQVIAEWVEDPRVARLLIEMGAQFGQGFLFQQPTELGATLKRVPSIQAGERS
jgi:diguanylate cyclase (GGDEF)-like protein/PAS domain S-box-containing protein